MKNWLRKELVATKFLRFRRGTALMTTLIVLLFVAVALGIHINAGNQTLLGSDDKDKGQITEKLEKSPSYPLSVKQDSDAPMKIIEANVIEASGSDYTKLTDMATKSDTVVSVPEVKLLNVSDKKITAIYLITRDLSANKSKGLLIRGLSVESGQNFTISRASFLKKEFVMEANDKGKYIEQTKPEMQADRYWLPFSDKSQLQVSLGIVFEDGSQWTNKEEGELK